MYCGASTDSLNILTSEVMNFPSQLSEAFMINVFFFFFFLFLKNILSEKAHCRNTGSRDSLN
jgi:hypothetical protein